MTRRALLLATAIIALLAAPAAAGTYDGVSGSGTVNADGDIEVLAEGFTPGSTVTYDAQCDGETVDSGETTADDSGAVSFTVDANGVACTYLISMTDGTNSGQVTVVLGDSTAAPPAQPTQTDELALTGSDSSLPMAQIGVVLVVLGAVGVYAAKRRRGRIFAD